MGRIFYRPHPIILDTKDNLVLGDFYKLKRIGSISYFLQIIYTETKYGNVIQLYYYCSYSFTINNDIGDILMVGIRVTSIYENYFFFNEPSMTHDFCTSHKLRLGLNLLYDIIG